MDKPMLHRKRPSRPGPYANTAEGTDCNYQPNGDGAILWFQSIFLSRSSAATGASFAKLKMFYSLMNAGFWLGDESLFDLNTDSISARVMFVSFSVSRNERCRAFKPETAQRPGQPG